MKAVAEKKKGDKLTYNGKPYKISAIDGDTAILKCLVCTGKTVKVKLSEL